MARKRMFSLDVIDTDNFLDMPLSSQALYFHLGMKGDDDGFISSPKTVIRSIGAKDDDLRVLISKGFVIPFESGVIVISHWKMNNTLKNDRYKPTIYKSEKEVLTENGDLYQLKNTDGIPNGYKVDTKWIQNGSKLEPQHNITKHNITERSILSAEAVAPAPVVGQSPTPKKPKKKIDEVDISKVADYFGNEKVNMAFNEFLKARKEIKGTKNTPRAVKLLIDTLKPFSPEEQYRAITTSIMNSWKGVFPKHITGSGATGTGNEFLDILIQNKGEL